MQDLVEFFGWLCSLKWSVDLSAQYFCTWLFYVLMHNVQVNFSFRTCVSRHNPGYGNPLGYKLEMRPSFCGTLPHLF